MSSIPTDAIPVEFAEAWLDATVRPRWVSWLEQRRRDYRSRDHYILYAAFDARLELSSYRFTCPLAPGHTAIVPPSFQHRLAVAAGDDPRQVFRLGFHCQTGARAHPLGRLVLPAAVPIGDRATWHHRCTALAETLGAVGKGDRRWPVRRARARPDMEWLLLDHLAAGFAAGRLELSRAGPADELVQAAILLLRNAAPRQLPSVGALAVELGISRYGLLKAFDRTLGTTPAAYRRRMRLEHAARLLAANPELAVQDVAVHCGFDSPAAFGRAFKAAWGVTPRRYRQGERMKAGSRRTAPSERRRRDCRL